MNTESIHQTLTGTRRVGVYTDEPSETPEPVESIPGERPDRLPHLDPESAPIDPREAGGVLRKVRRFHVNGPEEIELPALEGQWLPALVHPFYEPRKIRSAYPLFLFPPGADPAGRLCESTAHLFVEVLESLAPDPEDARILKDNLLRLDRFLRNATAESPFPVDADRHLVEARDALVTELALGAESTMSFLKDMDRLRKALPPGGSLLSFGEHSSCHLALLAARHHAAPRLAAFREELGDLCQKLKDLMRVEYEKMPESRTADALARGVGPVGAGLIDLTALSEMLGRPRGSEPLYDKRVKRIQDTWKTLDGFLSAPRPPALTLFHDGLFPEAWRGAERDLVVENTKTPCLAASRRFDEQAEAWAEIFRAARIARLETTAEFVPDTHKPLLARLDWNGFSATELGLLPPIVALEAPDTLAGQGMASLSRLLLSGRPIQVLARVISSGSPGVRAEDDVLTEGFRIELGFFGISHRVALVEQSTAARPAHLVDSLLRGLSSTRAALHVVSSGLCRRGVHPLLGSWLHSGCAIESRAHPLFRYDPTAGESWADRFDFTGNPQPQMDWPVYQFSFKRPDGSVGKKKLAFTFADFGLLEPAFIGHYREVPAGCPQDDLVPVEEWLRLPWEREIHTIPYVCAVDEGRRLARLVISRAMALACKDRLAWWHSLQELGGVNNTWARIAAERARALAQAEALAEREKLVAEHEAELDRVRLEEASKAMERLASALVSQDFTQAIAHVHGAAPRRGPAMGAASAEAGVPETSAATGDDEAEIPAEPWITSVLCTSCNECTNLNPLLFGYNANKQAIIKDPAAGTYAQLVIAAEKCPSRCIHPGRPQNPEEPGLESLVERARRFNG